MQIFKTKAFDRFTQKNGIGDSQLHATAAEVEGGLVDADLGGGVIKKRLAREGGGKRGGFRTLIAYQRGKRIIFLYGFPKSDMDNITQQDLLALRKLAKVYARLGAKEIGEAVRKGVFLEVVADGKKIHK